MPKLQARRVSVLHPSSATFWSLIDRWRVSDEQALELISYEGKLSATGRQPRFKLAPEQASIARTLLEIDQSLAVAGMDAAWIRRRPGKGERSPLDLMRAGAMDEVHRLLMQASLRASVRKRAPRKIR